MISPLAKRWLAITYLPSALFSLRLSASTSKGGRSLLFPSPFAIKCALINARIRLHGLQDIEVFCKEIIKQPVHIAPPSEIIVQNTFLRVLDKARPDSSGPGVAFTRTIAYREFVHFYGDLIIAIGIDGIEPSFIPALTMICACVNYFGKKGSFISFIGTRIIEGELPLEFSKNVPGEVSIMQMVDDFSPDAPNDKDIFTRLSPYSNMDLKPTQRVSRPYFIPFRVTRSTQEYTRYTRV